MDWTLLLFILLTLIFFIAWCGKYRLSIILFVFFLIMGMLTFLHHMTDSLPIHL